MNYLEKTKERGFKMNSERKPSITELIAALELHLSPRTDPDHCDPCPYDPVGDGALDVPQTTCQYRLMRDCLEALKQQKPQITMLEHSTVSAVKDFIQYFVDCYYNADEYIGEIAFHLGIAFTQWQELTEE